MSSALETSEGLKQSAIFLMTLGEEKAAEIFKYLTPREIQSIGKAMSELTTVETGQVSEVLGSFIDEVQKLTSMGFGTDKYIKNVLVKALGKDRAKGVLGNILTGSDSTGLDTLKWMDPKSIADIIRNEHPQIMAIVLSYMDGEQAAQVLGHIQNNDLRSDVVRRIATLDNVQPIALEELNFVLEQQFSEKSSSSSAVLGGVQTAADILNYLDKSIEQETMEKLKSDDEALCQEIEDQMFVFDNLLDVDDRGMQVILREVSTDVLILALKGATGDLKEKIFANMSKRAAELLKDDLESKGPVRISEVEAAQKDILAVTRRLSDAGEIVVGGGGGEEFI